MWGAVRDKGAYQQSCVSRDRGKGAGREGAMERNLTPRVHLRGMQGLLTEQQVSALLQEALREAQDDSGEFRSQIDRRLISLSGPCRKKTISISNS